jgi:hypothetical protein
MDVVVGASGPNGIKEDRLDALLERLDKLASHVEKSSTTIYQRRFIAFDLGNPGENWWTSFHVRGPSHRLLLTRLVRFGYRSHWTLCFRNIAGILHGQSGKDIMNGR